MAIFRFSHRAAADLLSIDDYTLRTWGGDRAARHLGELEVCCQNLANSPELGRTCDRVRPGLRRMETGSHVVFYRRDARGVLVARIPHQRMLPERHGFDDDV